MLTRLKRQSVWIMLSSFLYCTASPAQQKIGLESLIPPAPNAAEIGKYGTIPVGKVTGIPDISFPLYEIQSGSLKLPIILSYHSSGIHVNDKATDVGLGWSVMAGGQISRAVYGAADEGPYGYFNYTPPSYSTLAAINNYYTMATYNIVGNAGYDLEPDLFSYNIGGKSGKFHSDISHNFVTVPFEPIKIQTNNSAGGKLGFQITDDDGIIYNFSDYGTSHTESAEFGGPIGPRTTASTWYLTTMVSPDLADTIFFSYETQVSHDVMEQYVYPIGEDINGLVMGAAATVDGYVAGSQRIESQITYIEPLIKQITFRNGYLLFNRDSLRKDAADQLYSLDELLLYNSNNQLLRRFSFSHGYFNAYPFTDDAYHYRLKLTGFKESDSSGQNQKAYGFDYNATALPPYNSANMDYWGYPNGAGNLTLIPLTTILQSSLSTTTIQNSTYTNANIGLNSTGTWTFGDANREPSAANMAAGTLSKITYPTGGYTAFTFEPHKYISDNYVTQFTSDNGGATGINKLTKSTSSYSFTYPSNVDYQSVNQGSVIASAIINFSVSNMSNEELGPTQTVTLLDSSGNTIQSWTHTGDLTVAQTVSIQLILQPRTTYTFRSEVYGTNSVYANSSVSWTENTNQHETKIGGGLRIKTIQQYGADNKLFKEDNYVYGTGEDGFGVRLFDEGNFYRNYEDAVFDYFLPIGSAGACWRTTTTWQRKYLGLSKYNSINYMGSPILYSTVTQYEGTPSNNSGKTVSTFNIASDPISFPPEFVNSGNYGNINYAWHQGEPLVETVYQSKEGQYLPVSRTAYQYDTYNFRQDTAILFKQYKQFIKVNGPTSCGTDPTGPDPSNFRPGQGYFALAGYLIKSGAYKRIKEIKTDYDGQDTTMAVSTVTNIQYQNVAHLYPTQVTTTSSDTNVVKIIRFVYTQDTSGAVPTAMVAKNMLTPQWRVSTFQSKSGVESAVSTLQTGYKQAGNLIVRDSVKASTRAAVPEVRLVFNKYDGLGHIIEQQKSMDVKHTYIYAYNGAYPIAEVTNADSASVAYCSFETPEKGNWSFAGASVSDATAPTGGHVYSLSNGSISKSGLSSAESYIVSYWIKNTATPLTIAGTQTGYPRQGKTIGAWTYFEHKVTGQTSVSISGTASIDELRLYPALAQMTTYSYLPLIGQTNICDADNRITYYFYDGLGRLQWIKDQDGNIIKTFQYHYPAAPGL